MDTTLKMLRDAVADRQMSFDLAEEDEVEIAVLELRAAELRLNNYLKNKKILAKCS